MPREKSRKKTRYSSDSSDIERERERSTRRRYRERNNVTSKTYRGKSRRESDRSSSSSSRSSSYSSSSTSSSSSGEDKKNRNKRGSKKVIQKKEEPAQNFDLEKLYDEKDKSKILSNIEADSFKPASFLSQAKNKIVVDLEKDKILIPTSSNAMEDESLIHPEFLGDDSKRVDKWIKKLSVYRNNS